MDHVFPGVPEEESMLNNIKHVQHTEGMMPFADRLLQHKDFYMLLKDISMMHKDF